MWAIQWVAILLFAEFALATDCVHVHPTTRECTQEDGEVMQEGFSLFISRDESTASAVRLGAAGYYQITLAATIVIHHDWPATQAHWIMSGIYVELANYKTMQTWFVERHVVYNATHCVHNKHNWLMTAAVRFAWRWLPAGSYVAVGADHHQTPQPKNAPIRVNDWNASVKGILMINYTITR